MNDVGRDGSDDDASGCRCSIAGVGGTGRFNEEQFGLVGCVWLVFDPGRHDEELARSEFDIAVVHADRDASVEDQEQVVGVVVVVPDELSLTFTTMTS